MPILVMLNNDNILVGFKKVDLAKCKSGKNVIALPEQDECDLTPGKYKWDNTVKAFIPLGFGFGKPKPGPKLNTEMILFQLITTLKKHDTTIVFPTKVIEWLDWYDTELLKREDELIKVRGI